MKRTLAFFIALMIGIMMFSTCVAEENIIEATDEITYYVIRPHIKFVFDDGEATQLSFGDKVTLTDQQEEYLFVETEDGQKGKVTTGFVVGSYYPLIWIDRTGCFLAYKAGLTKADLGYGSGGQRWEEKAVILSEEDGYYLIVTDEGFSGYVEKDNPHITLYTGQVPSES